jgi:hypothetical protein
LLKEAKSIANYEHQSLAAETRDDQFNSSSPTFILCGKCYWCATFFDNARVPTDNNCPHCNESSNDNQLTSFPIMSNESLSFIVYR